MSHSVTPDNPVPLNNEEKEVRDVGKNVLHEEYAQPPAFPTEFIDPEKDHNHLIDYSLSVRADNAVVAHNGVQSGLIVGNNHPTSEETEHARNPKWREWIDEIVETVCVEINSEPRNSGLQPLENNVNQLQLQEPHISYSYGSLLPLVSPATETAQVLGDLAIGSVPGNNQVAFDGTGESFVTTNFQSGQCLERQKYHREMRNLQNFPGEPPQGFAPAPPSSSLSNQSCPSYYQCSRPIWESRVSNQQDSKCHLKDVTFSDPSQYLPVQYNSHQYVLSVAEKSGRPDRKIAVPRKKQCEKQGNASGNRKSSFFKVPEENLVWNNNEDYSGVTGVGIGRLETENSHCLDHPINTNRLLAVELENENDGLQILPDVAPPSNNEPAKPTRKRKIEEQSQKSEAQAKSNREASSKYYHENKRRIEELPKIIRDMAEELQNVKENNETIENQIQEHLDFRRDINDRLNFEKTEALAGVCETWKPQNEHMDASLRRFVKYKKQSNILADFNPEQFGKFLKMSLLNAEYTCKKVAFSENVGTEASQKSRRPTTLKGCELELAFSCLSFQIEKDKKMGEVMKKLRDELYSGSNNQWPDVHANLQMRQPP